METGKRTIKTGRISQRYAINIVAIWEAWIENEAYRGLYLMSRKYNVFTKLYEIDRHVNHYRSITIERIDRDTISRLDLNHCD